MNKILMFLLMTAISSCLLGCELKLKTDKGNAEVDIFTTSAWDSTMWDEGKWE
jgi:hypothetical protein